ncbi:hypothetical protein PB2503_02672 [Parvularcula bermudensis HTCC2503]|uniref:Thioesterase domain-containing protein n=1 Tax=Parvularcula bermudensis (strain ATCC BAA-594 / HTCC2503 / KCTC 12087) TaxID=314260 RepID=E0TCM2_PARBH|nr:tol-pal system-associated acyl-CoA thioesterase [Parvularcula bermudensis]ADM08611.1 hypothetical protein PB2503_02672 [Parvularcula bermudensis HTCC2503]
MTDTGNNSLSIRIYYEDTDAGGIVYHANYLKYFERGRTEALRRVHGDISNLASDPASPILFVVASIQVDFKRPGHLDDIIRIKTDLVHAKGARLIFDQRAYRGDTLLVRADVVVAATDGTGRPCRLPASLAAALLPNGSAAN